MVAALLLTAFLAFSPPARAQVKITIDRNAGNSATTDFKFATVPSPSANDNATRAHVTLIDGVIDSNSAGLAALTDGVLPTHEDQPESNFFFEAGTAGGRIRIDLGRAMDVSEVNTYSWHPDSRAPQVYNLYASDGSAPNFDPTPKDETMPADVGWKLIAKLDTRVEYGENGGQYGVSISDAGGSLGKYRYLLFDCGPTEFDDGFGNTFYSEVDVIAKK
jgi:hypothetical protein